MAKDPAFLFYSSDFLNGISDLTMEERGQYITLLCLQHQKGRLSDKMIRLCIGNAAADVLAKFRQDSGGNFYNVRLEEEINKRLKHSEKQKERALDGWKKRKNECHGISHGNATAMPLENENENRNENEIINEIKGGMGGNYIITEMCQAWYQLFPHYTQDQQNDYKAMGNILSFFERKEGKFDLSNNRTRESIISTLQAIGGLINDKIPFYQNASLKTISNQIQTFFNEIKNPKNGKSNGFTREGIQAEFEKRIAAKRRAESESTY